jgi:hypothetical protein
MPVSPDLAPSDFYLFGKAKTALIAATFEDEDQLFQGVMEMLHRIPRDDLKAVFDQRLVKLNTCIQRAGDYVESRELTKHPFTLRSRIHLAMLKVYGTPCINIMTFAGGQKSQNI